MRMAALVLLALAACANDSGVSRELGARCDSSRDCDDRCLLPDADYPGGLCTVTCNTDDECPSGSLCVDREGGICLFDCVRDSDCTFLGGGWTCHEGTAREDQTVRVSVCRGE